MPSKPSRCRLIINCISKSYRNAIGFEKITSDLWHDKTVRVQFSSNQTLNKNSIDSFSELCLASSNRTSDKSFRLNTRRTHSASSQRVKWNALSLRHKVFDEINFNLSGMVFWRNVLSVLYRIDYSGGDGSNSFFSFSSWEIHCILEHVCFRSNEINKVIELSQFRINIFALNLPKYGYEKKFGQRFK